MDMDTLADVPPAIPLLLSELGSGRADSFAHIKTRFRRLTPELKRQSEWFLRSHRAAPERSDGRRLDIFLDGALNLFDQEMCCPTLDCRIEAAKRLCRSVGLLGDTLWLTDYLSPVFAEGGRLTDDKALELINHTLVLKELEPFIAAGILRFKPAPLVLCASCASELDRQIDEIVDHLVQEFESEFDVQEIEDGIAMLTTGSLCDPPMAVLPNDPAVDDPETFSSAAWHFTKDVVRRVLWVAHQASPSGGSVFSNSKVGMAALAYREGLARDVQELRVLEDRSALSLPWVSRLTPAQVVQLRMEADKALPAFREAMAKALEAEPRKPGAVQDAIATLREQAADVRGELESTRAHAGRFWKSGFATLTMGVSAFGAATGDVPVAVSGLLSLMTLMVNHKAGAEREVDKLKRRPGYVLIKAEDILSHAH